MIVGVLLPLPFNEPFDYRIDDDVELGEIVRVPFGREAQIGVVWKKVKSSKLDDAKIKPVTERFNFPPLHADLRKFIEFTAAYNMAYAGLVLRMVLSVRQVFDNPKMTVLYELSGKTLAEAGLKNSAARWRVMDFLKAMPFNRQEIAAGAGVGQSVIRAMIDAGVLWPVLIENKRQFAPPVPDFQKVKLTREQQAAADELVRKVGHGFRVTLLNGVTGSGKTEVYFEAAAEAFRQGKQVLRRLVSLKMKSER